MDPIKLLLGYSGPAWALLCFIGCMLLVLIVVVIYKSNPLPPFGPRVYESPQSKMHIGVLYTAGILQVISLCLLMYGTTPPEVGLFWWVIWMTPLTFLMA